jgi:hypothetical protein
VIVVVGDRAFRAASGSALQKLLRRELPSEAKARLLDSTWEWFELMLEVDAIAPSFLDRLPPTKKAVIAIVNGRSNRAADAPLYELRSLSSRTRVEIFAQLLSILPAG